MSLEISNIIPETDLRKGYRNMVHVRGWTKGACFLFLGFDEFNNKILKTPRTNKIVKTKNDLFYTNRYITRNQESC